MKIKTTEKCKSVDNAPVKAGTVLAVDANTARNLIKKGFAEAADDDAKALNLSEGSKLTAADAQAHIAEAVAAKESKKGK